MKRLLIMFGCVSVLGAVFASGESLTGTEGALLWDLNQEQLQVIDAPAVHTLIDEKVASKQDTLTAGASIDISEQNVISVYGDEVTHQTAGPAAAGDKGEGMGYYGTVNNILGETLGTITLRNLSIMRRTNNANWYSKTLYCRVLRWVDGAWATAMQSSNGIYMSSVAVDEWLGPWKMEPTAPEHASFPAGETIRIVWVEDTSVAANVNTQIGCRTTGTYRGFIGANNTTVYDFAPCFKLTYRTGFATQSYVDNVITTHTHTTSQITDLENTIDEVKTWVNAQSPDADGNINKSNLNSRADTVSDMTYITEGGTASRAISAITPEGNTKAQIQQVLDTTDAAHLSANVMVEGATATVKARTLNGSTIHQAMLSATASEAKLTLADTTGTLTLTPTTQWPWSKLSGVPSTFTPATHNHDSAYLKLSGGTATGTIAAPILNATTYFVTPKLVNEASNPYNHALNLGYANHDYWEFLEYGGDFRFYKSTGANTQTQVARITTSGIYEGTTLLANKYAAKSHTHTEIATLQSGLATVTSTANTNMADIFTLQTEAATHAPVSAVTMTEENVIYIWQWDADAETFALVPQE